MQKNHLKISAITLAIAVSFFGCSDEWDKGMPKCWNEGALSTIDSQHEEYAQRLIEKIKKDVPESQAKKWREAVEKNHTEKRIAEFLDLPSSATYSTTLAETKLNYKNFLTVAMDKDIRKRKCSADVDGTLSLGQYGSIKFSDDGINYAIQPSDDDENMWTWFGR